MRPVAMRPIRKTTSWTTALIWRQRSVFRAAKLFKEGKPISSVIAGLEEPAECIELRFPILAPDFGAYGDEVLEYLRVLAGSGQLKGAALAEPNYEGVRIDFHTPTLQGWLLLRKSLHDPIMPLNIESDTVGGTDEIRQTAEAAAGRLRPAGQQQTVRVLSMQYKWAGTKQCLP